MPKPQNTIHTYISDTSGELRKQVESFGALHGLSTSAVFRIAVKALMTNPERQMAAISKEQRKRS